MKSGAIWIVFSTCLLVVLGAAAWLTTTVLDLEAQRHTAEENDRIDDLALRSLWRMEYAVVPLVVQEAARPFFHYYPFYATDLAYARMGRNAVAAEGVEASPLLTDFVPFTRLHFQIGPTHGVTSPQCPDGEFRVRAEAAFGPTSTYEEAGRRILALKRLFGKESLQRVIIEQEGEESSGDLVRARPSSLLKNLREFRARRQQVQQAQSIAQNRVQLDGDHDAWVDEGPMRPYWCAGSLFLARHLVINGHPYVQGCWLDWDAVRERLVEDVRELLPNAVVEPLRYPDRDPNGLMLASLPVRLVPGSIPAAQPAGVSPLRLSLLLAVGCVAIAAIACAFLLRGILVYSERRGAFVSAVTHELRTPLTTLRMYTELLADGRVTGDEKRQRYFGTLKREADRLGHLVENVLAYSRIEATGKESGRVEVIALADLVGRATERAVEFAATSGRSVEVARPAGADRAMVRADVDAVEQVLFNLVDNACKYADPARDRRILIEAEFDSKRARIAVRDFGPGITAEQRRRLFRPFSKSVDEAARTKPGVGLGLALCRGLALRMGGSLALDSRWQEGAAFVLEVPRD